MNEIALSYCSGLLAFCIRLQFFLSGDYLKEKPTKKTAITLLLFKATAPLHGWLSHVFGSGVWSVGDSPNFYQHGHVLDFWKANALGVQLGCRTGLEELWKYGPGTFMTHVHLDLTSRSQAFLVGVCMNHLYIQRHIKKEKLRELTHLCLSLYVFFKFFISEVCVHHLETTTPVFCMLHFISFVLPSALCAGRGACYCVWFIKTMSDGVRSFSRARRQARRSKLGLSGCWTTGRPE